MATKRSAKTNVEAVITNLNPDYQKAARLLKAPNGATVEQLAKQLKLEERPARLLIDRLRRKGLRIRNVSRNTFKVESGAGTGAGERAA
jgi:predicted ArsR family transcriptional regulator